MIKKGCIKHHSPYTIYRSPISAQSLFEVVLSIALISIVMITVVSLASTTTRNSTFSRNKTEANRYAQEGIEWLRQQRDLMDYGDFYNATVDKGSVCLGTLSFTSGGGDCSLICPTAGNCTIFRRNGIFVDTDGSVSAYIEITWTDGQGEHTIKNETILTDWRVRP